MNSTTRAVEGMADGSAKAIDLFRIYPLIEVL